MFIKGLTLIITQNWLTLFHSETMQNHNYQVEVETEIHFSQIALAKASQFSFILYLYPARAINAWEQKRLNLTMN